MAARTAASRATVALEETQRRAAQWERDLSAALDGWQADLDELTRLT